MIKVSTDKKYKGAVFFDIDGTLIEITRGIYLPPPSAAEGVAKLRENGYLTAIATGRAEAYIPDLGLEVDCIISCNGAALTKGGQPVFECTMPYETLSEIIKYLKEKSCPFVLETTKNCYYSGAEGSYFSWISKDFYPLDDYEEEIKDFETIKICAFYKPEILPEIRERFGEKVYVIAHRHNPFADIGALGVSKGAGIKKALEVFGIDISDTYAFGDDNNDLEMLSTVAHGIAMTPHAPALDGVAEYVTESVADGGIYNALKHYNLI